ncbi:MAG: hypothetical protein ACE5FA_01790, partial [Dehalococcoidia bacterium]
MAENLSKTFLLTAIAACGVLIVAFSFLPWVNFDSGPLLLEDSLERSISFSLSGTEISRLQGGSLGRVGDGCTCKVDFGDGYITAIFGAVVAVAASAAILLRSRGRFLTIPAILASLVAFGMAGYNATGIWEGVGLSNITRGSSVNLDGDVRLELFTLTLLGQKLVESGFIFCSQFDNPS